MPKSLPNIHRIDSRIAFLVVCAILPVMVGCGDSVDGKYPLKGTVKLDGKLLDYGTVEIVSADGANQTGGAIADGYFQIPASQGLPPGTYIVRISSIEEGAGPEPTAPGEEAETAPNKERIPKEFNIESKLTINVTADGSNDFTLTIP